MGKLFARLDTDKFNQYFIQWINNISKLTDGELVAIDGKTIKGSVTKGSGKAFHIVSAYASQNRLSLGQVVTNEKSNEITAIPELLELISIKGCIVTVDAMGCQKKIAQAIISNEAN